MEIPASLLMSSGNYSYVVVKASVHSEFSSVFGLNEDETKVLVKRFCNYKEEIVNGIMLKATPLQMINTLGQLGYRVVASTGEAEILWTMQRDL